MTGRSVVVFAEELCGDRPAMTAALRSLTGISSVVETSEHRARGPGADPAAGAQAIAFDTLGVAVVARDPTELAASLHAAAAEPDAVVVAVEPEHVMRAICVQRPAGTAPSADDVASTWGLRAIGADASRATGRAVRVAVLDTGLDLEHPDFDGRPVTALSFVAGASARDGHGHGTHCTGTACGPAAPVAGRRYGVASEAEIFAGRVLDDSGSGTDASILAGIEWAIANGCAVISMSLGADVPTVSTAYETVGRRALAAGVLIVAAAGNNAARAAGNRGFVGIPANSPSIMAVAAVDRDLKIADLSAAGSPVEGGEIDIAAPGVDVYSSWPMPGAHNTLSGTSMAAPHVAGAAALWSQADGAEGRALWEVLVQAARPLDLPASDAGAGLVQAPS